MKNRNIFPRIGALLLFVVLTPQILAQKIDIQSTGSTSQIYRVQTVLEGRGVVIPEEDQTLKMNVDARFQYNERVIARTSQLKSIRSYEQALAKIYLDGKSIINQLAAEKSIVITQTKGVDQPIKLASLGGPISQNEFELINTPANTLILAKIFEKRSVKKGDSWKPENQVLARFLNIDSIDKTDVEIELASLKGTIATLVIAGETTGVIDGAMTELSLNGNASFDTARGIVTRSEITILQQRDVGLLAPGLDATFKLITKIQPIATSKYLSDEGLTELRTSSGKITDNLLLSPLCSSISLLHPRNWRVISDHQARTILRYNKSGRMIGQCDIIPLPNRLADQQQTLEQFKAVVKNNLADSSGEISGGSQSTTESGLQWLRVDASGTSNGVNLNWTYYTITNPDGRRVQLVFTTEPSNARSFAGMEQYLIDSMRFESTEKTTTQNAAYRKSSSRKSRPEK